MNKVDFKDRNLLDSLMDPDLMALLGPIVKRTFSPGELGLALKFEAFFLLQKEDLS